MRIALEVVAVLEGPRLTLVGVDCEHARGRFRPHKSPLAARRKARAAKAAQSAVAHDPDQLIARAVAGQATFQERVATGLLIRGKVGIRFPGVRMRTGFHRRCDAFNRRFEGLDMTDRADRCAVARTHAWRADNAYVSAELAAQLIQQPLGTRHRARQGFAYAHRDRRWRRLALLHHVEMRVERGDFVNLRERHLHFGGERGEMGGGDVTVAVLDEMKMLDQQITAARPVSQKGADLIKRLRLNLTTLGRSWRTAPAATSRGGTCRPMMFGDAHCSSTPGAENRV